MNNIENFRGSQGIPLQTPSIAAQSQQRAFREQMMQSSQVNRLMQQRDHLPPIPPSRGMNMRSQSSKIIIADAHHQPKERETISMMKQRELQSIEPKESNIRKFTKSGNNITPAGVGRNYDTSIYQVGPSRLDSHPENFYKSNRLSSKAQMHDFRPQKVKKSEFSGMLAHKMTSSTRQKRLNS